jgi:Flp pilus assembly protein TadD
MAVSDRLLLTLLPSYKMGLWDFRTGLSLTTMEGHSGSITEAEFSPDGETLASSSWDGTVRLWEVATGRQLAQFPGGGCLAFSPDGKTLAAHAYDDTIKFWSILGHDEVMHLHAPHESEVYKVRFSSDGGALLCWDSREMATVWRVPLIADVDAARTSTEHEPLAMRVRESLLAGGRSSVEPIDVLRRRGETCGRSGRYAEATNWLTQVVELDPNDHTSWCLLAPLLVETGDAAGYYRHCQAMLDKFGGTRTHYLAERTAKACLLLPLSGEQLEAANALAERAVTLGAGDVWMPAFEFAKGLADYRRGEFGSAETLMRHVLATRDKARVRDAQAWFVLAMARHRLGKIEEGRAALDQGAKVVTAELPGLGSSDMGRIWGDVLTANILMRQAIALFKTKEGQPLKSH